MWPQATRTTTFHNWLNAPADADLPLITNLAAFFWRTWLDVRAAFPDLYGQHRIDALFWIVGHAAQEYELEDDYIVPLRQSLVEWATRPAMDDPAALEDVCVPTLTNLVAYIHQRRPDLQAAFPDLYRRHRMDMLLWTMVHAPAEYPLGAAAITLLRQQFMA